MVLLISSLLMLFMLMGYIPGYNSGPVKTKVKAEAKAKGSKEGSEDSEGDKTEKVSGGPGEPGEPREIGEPGSLEEFFKRVRRDVMVKMDEVIGGRPDEEKIRYALGGKLLRPCLGILVYETCSYGRLKGAPGAHGSDRGDYERALESAVASELAHSSSLVHDDILDEDDVRRGRPALHRILDPKEALLVGHRMINLALSTVLDHGYPIIKTFLSTWDRALSGEVEDVEISQTAVEKFTALPVPSRKLYFDVILKKTGGLFSASAKVGAHEAGADPGTVEFFERWGEKIGLVYQLCDDYVDLKKGKLEKLTLLPLISLQQLEEGAKEALIGLITDGRMSPVEGLMSLGIDASRFFTNEIRKALSKAEEMVKEFQELVKGVKEVKENPYTPLLAEMPGHIANSMLKEINVEIHT